MPQERGKDNTYPDEVRLNVRLSNTFVKYSISSVTARRPEQGKAMDIDHVHRVCVMVGVEEIKSVLGIGRSKQLYGRIFSR